MQVDEYIYVSRSQSRYQKFVSVIRRPAGERTRQDINTLEKWLKLKSKLLCELPKETLLDVIQHCEFVTREKDDVIIHQGEKGHRFYIVLRGSVAILLKEALEDVDLGEEGSNLKADRSTLGNHIASLGEGSPFGEIALMNADCIRTASVVAEERTDLVVIHRDLYNRSVKKVVAREYSEKINFIEAMPLTQHWMPKFRKQLAASFKRELLPFDCVLFKQGDPATDIFFIVRGEVKLVVDPEAHYQQYEKFMDKCGSIVENQEDIIQNEKAYFPQKLLPQLAKYSRVNKASLLQRPDSSADGSVRVMSSLPKTWSPSAIRKMNAQIHAKKVSINLCYLGEKQCVGDIEALLGLDVYHATAVCSQETVVMMLNRSHFERLFKKRNARSTKDLAQILELQLTRRLLKPNIIESVPLLKCFIYKLQELYKRTGDTDDAFSLPLMNFDTYQMRKEQTHAHLSRGYTWAAATRDMNGSRTSRGGHLHDMSVPGTPHRSKTTTHINGFKPAVPTGHHRSTTLLDT